MVFPCGFSFWLYSDGSFFSYDDSCNALFFTCVYFLPRSFDIHILRLIYSIVFFMLVILDLVLE